MRMKILNAVRRQWTAYRPRLGGVRTRPQTGFDRSPAGNRKLGTSKTPKMDEGLATLWKNYKKTRDPQLRNKLVERYLGLVKAMAMRIYGTVPESIDQLDLTHAGVCGLMDAIDHFDINRGVKFETYSSARIRGAILDELRSQDWSSRAVRQRVTRLDQVCSRLRAALGRQPTDAEMAQGVGIPLEGLPRFLAEANHASVKSLDNSWAEDTAEAGSSEFGWLHDEGRPGPLETLERKDTWNLVTRRLNHQETIIMGLYYMEELTMKEIGHILGVSESRVCQIHTRVIDRLRTFLAQHQAELVT